MDSQKRKIKNDKPTRPVDNKPIEDAARLEIQCPRNEGTKATSAEMFYCRQVSRIRKSGRHKIVSLLDPAAPFTDGLIVYNQRKRAKGYC